ncbi:MAG: hypothetical protein P1U56_13800 [Saprospiraceae bacterium]|nr:hypothetical protein [Saprospiraceae bacterium]
MQIRDFFRLIIKLFGLYALLTTIIQFIPFNFSMFIYEEGVMSYFWLVAILLIIVGIFIGMVKNADLLIDWLHLEHGFEEKKINFGNLDESKMFSLTLILIGGFLIIDYFPSFLHNCYYSFRTVADTKGLDGLIGLNYTTVSYFDWTMTFINIVVGYLLIVNHKGISRWLVRKV